MKIKSSVFIATSLDGFIARKDGGIDWLLAIDEPDENEDYGFGAFMNSVDGIVMGRNTFELAITFEQWLYGEKPLFVMSSQNVIIPEKIRDTVFHISGSPAQVVRKLEQKGFKHLYVDGGKTIQGFLNENLIDELIITKIPVLIGRGIPLFGPLSMDIRLAHEETNIFEQGLVQSRYRVIKN